MPVLNNVSAGIKVVSVLDEFNNPVIPESATAVQLKVTLFVLLEILTKDDVSPEVIYSSTSALTCTVGFTVIVKVLSSPAQTLPSFSNSGVTMMVATIGSVVKLVAMKLILSFPERPAPICVSDTQL